MTQLHFEVTRRDGGHAAASASPSPREPGFGKTFTDHMVVATWTPERRLAARAGRGPTGRSRSTRPRRCCTTPRRSSRDQGLPPRRRLDLDLPARGQRRPLRPLGPPPRAARAARADFIESLRQLVTVDQAWVPAGDAGEKSLYLRPFMFASEAFLGVRPAQRGHLLRHRLPGRRLLRRRAQARDAVDLHRLRPRGRGWHRRRQVRRQLRQPRSPASSRASSTAATRPSSSTPRRTPTSRSSAA